MNPEVVPKTLFDTKQYILGPALGNSHYNLRSFGVSAKETDSLLSDEIKDAQTLITLHEIIFQCRCERYVGLKKKGSKVVRVDEMLNISCLQTTSLLHLYSFVTKKGTIIGK